MAGKAKKTNKKQRTPRGAAGKQRTDRLKENRIAKDKRFKAAKPVKRALRKIREIEAQDPTDQKRLDYWRERLEVSEEYKDKIYTSYPPRPPKGQRTSV